MSYPTYPKNMLKMGKDAARRLLHPYYLSAWQRHVAHKCLVKCWYCEMEKKFRRSALDQLVQQAQDLKMGY